MVRKLQTVLLMCFLLATFVANGQKKLQKANKQYDLKHYELAIESFKDFLVEDPGNTEARINLADSYRMSNDLVSAAELYEKLVTLEFIDPTVIKKYGLTLMKMGQYDQAKYYFQIYKVYDPAEGEHYAMACEYAKHLFIAPSNYEIELVNINTPQSDFGVSFYKDQLIFSSFRSDLPTDSKSQALNGNILYTADLSDDMRAENVRFLRSGISEKVNIGPVSYDENGGIVAFARNKIKDGGAHVTGDDSKHSLYTATLTAEGDWDKEQSFKYNEFGTSTAFPSLAFDGSALYFSSNRVGGYGGYDIYVCYMKNGEWSYPKNLGPTINTLGNEITPFFNEESLYFASDYMHGMGGYDIFESKVNGGLWTQPTNMGNGINSPGDDYYPSMKKGSDMIFFSSNRLGGRGMDDIYLAAPVSEQVFVDNVPPPAVRLSDLAVAPSDAAAAIGGSEPVSQVVSNMETTEVKILNPVVPVERRSMIELPQINLRKIASVDSKEWMAVCNLGYVPVSTHSTTIDAADYETEIMVSDAGTERIETNIEVDEDGSLVEHISMSEIELLENVDIAEAVAKGVASEDKSIETLRAVEVQVPVKDLESTTANEDVAISEDVKPEAFKIPSFTSVSPSAAPLNLDISSAKRVALNEMLPSGEVFFIQLAALYQSKGNVDKYNGLKKYGNLYKVYKSNSTKIKLGYFLDKSEAVSVLKQVKGQGYSDAFITRDQLNSSELELVVASEAQSNFDSYTSKPATTKPYSAPKSSNYKIRLASYEDPIWFDIAKAKGLGQIEQWTKGGWTIFILSGYTNYDEAESARIRAVNQGFADAEVVIDNNGILERLRHN